jgi:hypothetical protein
VKSAGAIGEWRMGREGEGKTALAV